jgi:hypothetical protein
MLSLIFIASVGDPDPAEYATVPGRKLTFTITEKK